MEDFHGFEEELHSAPETNQFAFVFPWSTSSQAYDTSSFDPTLCGGLITRAEVREIKKALKKVPRPINPEKSEHINSVFIFILLFSFIGLAVNLFILARFSDVAGLIAYISFGVGCLLSLAVILCSAVKRIRNKKLRGRQMLSTLSHIQKTLLDQKACLISISKLEAYIMIEFCWKFAAIADDLGQLTTQTSDLPEAGKLVDDQHKAVTEQPAEDDDKLDESEPEDIPYLPNLEILENQKKKKKLDLEAASAFLKSISDVAQHAQNIQQLVQQNIKKLAAVTQQRLKTEERPDIGHASLKEGGKVEETAAALNKQSPTAYSTERRGLFVVPQKQPPQKGLETTDETPLKPKQGFYSPPTADYKRIQLSINQEEATHLVSDKSEALKASDLKLKYEPHAFLVPREDSQPSPRSNRESDRWSTGKNATIKKDRYFEKKIFSASKCFKLEPNDIQVKTSSQIDLQPNMHPSRDSVLLFESGDKPNNDGSSNQK